MLNTIEVTDVRISIPERNYSPRLLAFAEIELAGALVIHDLRVVRVANGRVAVAMPNRTHLVRCEACDHRASIRANFCGHCGARLPEPAPPGPGESLYHDVAFPVHNRQRMLIERAVLGAYLTATTAPRPVPTRVPVPA